jgi:hypothetical protein
MLSTITRLVNEDYFIKKKIYKSLDRALKNRSSVVISVYS